MPAGVGGAFGQPGSVHFRPGLGECIIYSNAVQISASSSFGCATAGMMPERCTLEVTVTFAEGTKGCGIMLRASDDLEKAYFIRLEPHRGRMVFDGWPRKGDVPFMVELERPLKLRPGQAVELKVLVDGTVCEG